MKEHINYLTAFPDFITMQRVSFCWFLNQGLSEELALFSRIHDFSENTEYVLFAEEYRLIKPARSIVFARKYDGNYRVHLVIPLEIRNKELNEIRHHSYFPLTTLPLMTNSATFVINGCERIIVSQIIRSPGIYFEKNKKQKKRNQFRRKLSADITKLRSFLPSGEAFLSEFDLFFPIPAELEITFSSKEKRIVEWKNKLIFQYSITYLQQKINYSCFYFFHVFKLYRIILMNLKFKKKIKLIKLFFKWLKSKAFSLNVHLNFIAKSEKIRLKYLCLYFNLLIQLLRDYQILQQLFIRQNIKIKSKLYDLLAFKTYSDYFVLKLAKMSNNFNQNIKTANIRIILEVANVIVHFYEIIIFSKLYTKIITNSQKFVQINLNSKLLFVVLKTYNQLIETSNFKFLKQTVKHFIQNINKNNNLIKFRYLRPTLYFSASLKEQLKYVFSNISEIYDSKHHKYLKTKSQFLLYKEDHDIKTNYHKKYVEKDLYTAILIPEYGSWIRFIFQKNTTINPYKYPIKNQEDEILIQLDKINQKPIIFLLKEIGLTDFEIYRNLQHSDFFYFTQPLLLNSDQLQWPLLRFDLNSNYFDKISEFFRIFDATYYRLGKVGRLKINERLNLKLSYKSQTITYDDIFAIIDKLITLTISKTIPDDIDHLKNRRVRSVGELLQNQFRIGFQRLIRKLQNQTDRIYTYQFLSFNLVNRTIKEFFGSSELSQYLDQTNPLSSLTHKRRISGLGPGGFDRDRVSFAVRDIHPSHYGRICPIETSEGKNVGLIATLTTCARVNKTGFLETPFWRVVNGKIIQTGTPIYLTADVEDLYKIAPADIITNKKNYLTKNVITVRYRQDFISVPPFDVDFIAISPIQIVSVAASLIPFFEHDDANRALMGSNMQRQSVPLLMPQKPIVGTGLENQIAMDSGMTLNAQYSGVVDLVTANKIVIKDRTGKNLTYKLQKYLGSNQKTCINHRPIVWKGEKIKSGQIITDGPAITTSELSLGQNVLVSYMPWQGYNFEDAILINERLIYDDIFTSIHIERYKIEIDRTSEIVEQTTKDIPNLDFSEFQHLNDDGIVKVGTFINPGNILVGKVILNDNSDQLPESKLLSAIFGVKAQDVKDNSFRMPEKKHGRIIETITFNYQAKLTYEVEIIYIFIAQIRKIQVGDKIAGRHGNKGIISRILPRQDMPFLPDGTPVDIILNPLGVPSRMNVGQLYECLLGLAGDKLNCRFKIMPFDEMYGLEISRILINKKLRQASLKNDESWLFNPYAPGKMVLIDGRTGKEFENPITVGNAYMLKLIHLVDDKMHARAVGPYSIITQQPLRGKAQQGGQRFGEMEVWALEGFGAAFTLKELLTIKSDDMQGRSKTLNAILKGQQIPKFGIPESFKVLLQELRSIGIDISTYKIKKFSSSKTYEVEVNLIEKYNALSKTFSSTLNINEISF